MPISTAETVPNFPLNGSELGNYAVRLLGSVIESRGVLDQRHGNMLTAALLAALAADWVFKPSNTWAGASFSIACQCHEVSDSFAFTLEPVFYFPNNPAFPEHRPFVRRPVGISAPPIESLSGDAAQCGIFDCFTITATVDNPNLVRVHCGMPVVIQNKVPPKHGELFGKIEDHSVLYDPKDYQPLPPPNVTDQTADFCAKWGIPFESFPADSSNGDASDNIPLQVEAPSQTGELAAEGKLSTGNLTAGKDGQISPPELSGEGEGEELARVAQAEGQEPPAQDVNVANRLMQERRESKRRDRRAER